MTGATYGPDGAIAGFINGSGGAAAITNLFSYNKRLQPLAMSATFGSPVQTVFSISYDFHLGNGDNGNVWGITNNKDTTRNQSFTYDALNRVIAEWNAGTASEPAAEISIPPARERDFCYLNSCRNW